MQLATGPPAYEIKQFINTDGGNAIVYGQWTISMKVVPPPVRGWDGADRHGVGARDRPSIPGCRPRAGHGKFGERPAGTQLLVCT